MKEKYNFLKRYLCHAPIFLAIERAIECRLISSLALNKPILDLGCGDGLFSSILFTTPPDVGIDISLDELLKSLEKKAYRNIINGNLSMLPLKAKSVNTIVCNSVMEHVMDLREALREAHRVLFPEGRFILTLPTENYVEFLFYPRVFQGLGLKKPAEYYRNLVNKIFKHYHAYTPAEWIKIIEESGFKVLKTIQYCPGKVMAVSDFYLPFSSIGLLNKKIFRRWILCTSLRKYIAGYLELLLRKSYIYEDSTEGACILIEAQRV